MSGPCVVVSFMPVWMLAQSFHFLLLVVFYTHSFSDHQNQVFLFHLPWISGHLACSKPLIKPFINFCVGFWAASDHRYFTFILVTETLVYLYWCTKEAAPYVLVSLIIYVLCNFCKTPTLSPTAWFLTPASLDLQCKLKMIRYLRIISQWTFWTWVFGTWPEFYSSSIQPELSFAALNRTLLQPHKFVRLKSLRKTNIQCFIKYPRDLLVKVGQFSTWNIKPIVSMGVWYILVLSFNLVTLRHSL